MGGSGSGNWYRGNTKPTEEYFWRFSAASLKKHGVIGDRKCSSGNWQWLRNGEIRSFISYEVNTLENPSWLRVRYTNKSSGKDYDYKIYLTTTQPHYGGVRWWLTCPAQGCGRRVSVLYLAHVLACRHCHNFAYNSQNEATQYRLLHKAQKIHQELGGNGVINIFNPPKPKGMHWKTYRRKTTEIRQYNLAATLEMARRLKIEL